MQLLPLPGNAQAKIEDMSRLLLNHVSQMPSKMPMAVIQVTESKSQPLAGVTQRIAVRLISRDRGDTQILLIAVSSGLTWPCAPFLIPDWSAQGHVTLLRQSPDSS